MNKKYFICSDLHGIHPDTLSASLINNGFSFTESLHILVVLGDITDGHQHEDILIDFLNSLELIDRLLILKGNHDLWGTNKMPMHKVASLTIEQKTWLNSLPPFIEHPKFNLAHGIYLPKNIRKKLLDPTIASLHGSPCLLENGKWNRTLPADQKKIQDTFPSILDYVQSLTKPTFVGHFTKTDVQKHLSSTGLLQVHPSGFLHINHKLFFTDGGISKNPNLVQIIVFPLE